MTTEQGTLTDTLDPLRILKGRNFVAADTYIVRRPINFSDKTAKENVSTRLSSQGVTGTIAVTFWNSEEERIKEIIKSLKMKRDLSASKDPWMGIVVFDDVQLQKMSEVISRMIRRKDPIIEGVDPKNITILHLNAPSHTDSVPMESGVRIATLKKGELAYPTQPTPAH